MFSAPLPAVIAVCVALSGVSYRFAASTQPGWARFGVLAPIAAILFGAPLIAGLGPSEVLLSQTLCCIFSMSAFKVIALASGRGCLEGIRSLWHFLGLCLLPVIPLGPPGAQIAGALVTRSLYAAAAKLASFALLGVTSLAAIHATERAEQKGVNVLLLAVVKMLTCVGTGAALMLQVEGMGDLVDAAAMALFGVAPDKHFDRVWEATSMSDLWGRRWNLTVSAVLRGAVYEPVAEGRWFAAQPPAITPPARSSSLQLLQSEHSCQASGGTAVAPPAGGGPAALLARADTRDASDCSPAGSACLSAVSSAASLPSLPSLPSPYSRSSHSSASSSSRAHDNSSSDASPRASDGSCVAPRPSPNCSSPHGAAAAAFREELPSAAAAAHPQERTHAPVSHAPIAKGPARARNQQGGQQPQHGPAPSTHLAAAQHAPHEAPGTQQPRRVHASKARRFVALLATFLVSGLWHELVCYCMTRQTTRGVWTAFFVLQALILSVEKELKHAWRAAGRRPLPRWLSVALTQTLFWTMLALMWQPPMLRTGMHSALLAQGDAAVARARELGGALGAAVQGAGGEGAWRLVQEACRGVAGLLPGVLGR